MSGFGDKKNTKNKSINKKSKSKLSIFKKNKLNNSIQNQDPNEILKMALKFHSEGNLIEASKYYQIVLDKGVLHPQIFSNYGVLLRILGEIDKAKNLFKKSIKLFPEDPNSYINLANIYRDHGNFKDAEYNERLAIELNPNDEIAYSNLSNTLSNIGKIDEAEFFARKAIEINPSYEGAYNNLATILRDVGRTKEAEISINESIKLKPNYAKSYSQLAGILIDLGRIKEAEIALIKSLKIDPNNSQAIFIYSTFKKSKEEEFYKKILFSNNILENKSKKECIDIYFAKANVLHFEKKYKESAKNLVLGNESKRTITIMDTDELIKKSFFLLNQSNEETYCSNKISNNPESIFIVGMPRCGSTLLESILSMNKQVNALGEVNILEDSYNEIYQNSNKEKKKTSLYERYLEKIKILNKSSPITTNKLLYNFQYTGIILKNIPRSKIVFCYRDPLDNILSIYRAHFSKSNYYASSIIETAHFYAHHKDIMNKYIEKYREKIYALNYDLLVSDPSNEIKKMITWLGWEWNDFYLTPHLNKRSVSTASNIQVRSPINNNSLGGWKNYRDILKPAIEIIENKKI